LPKEGAIIGVSDHNGWAVLVTLACDERVLDRRRIKLVDADLPTMPHHHDAQGLPLAQALDLVERVRVSAERHARLALAAVTSAAPSSIRGIAMRACPPLPPTIAQRLQDYRAQNVADTVMYRNALAGAAESRGWPVYWYNAKKVFDAACDALNINDLDAYFLKVRQSIGPPWNQDHKLAMAAAIVAARQT